MNLMAAARPEGPPPTINRSHSSTALGSERRGSASAVAKERMEVKTGVLPRDESDCGRRCRRRTRDIEIKKEKNEKRKRKKEEGERQR